MELQTGDACGRFRVADLATARGTEGDEAHSFKRGLEALLPPFAPSLSSDRWGAVGSFEPDVSRHLPSCRASRGLRPCGIKRRGGNQLVVDLMEESRSQPSVLPALSDLR